MPHACRDDREKSACFGARDLRDRGGADYSPVHQGKPAIADGFQHLQRTGSSGNPEACQSIMGLWIDRQMRSHETPQTDALRPGLLSASAGRELSSTSSAKALMPLCGMTSVRS